MKDLMKNSQVIAFELHDFISILRSRNVWDAFDLVHELYEIQLPNDEALNILQGE